MASYYDEYSYYGEPDYYGGSATYQEPDTYNQPNIYYEEPNEEPNNYEEPQYYDLEDVPYCHTGSEPADNELGYENGPTYEDMIPRLPCYEDLHPIYQDHVEGLGDCTVEEDRDDEECGSNKFAECPPCHPSLNNVADNDCPSGWVNPDPNYELSLEKWEALVAEQNAAEEADLVKREQKLEETFVLFNSMDPLEQDELNNRLDLLYEDMDDTHSYYRKFMDIFGLMAAEKNTPLFSLDTAALPPQFECSPQSQNHIFPTISRPP